MSTSLILFLAILALVILAIIIGGRKKRWYRVYMVNNYTFLCYRTTNDFWWRDSQGLIGFHSPDGKRIGVSKHNLIKIEENDAPNSGK
ncbi:hypothetical protein LCGC14_0969230 [marine sediment metagenome]|uniref:Uncharacterized protein n=1 Tax=marine sediment metagenome TaxID=412755 RepID=A0A0F9QVA3_9ZZZZ